MGINLPGAPFIPRECPSSGRNSICGPRKSGRNFSASSELGNARSRRKRDLTHEWPHESAHEWPYHSAHESAHESTRRADFPLSALRGLPIKAPIKHPTEVSTEGPTSGRSWFTCRVFTCSGLWPKVSGKLHNLKIQSDPPGNPRCL